MPATRRSAFLASLFALSGTATAAAQPARLSADDLGARYGQALGASLVCPGARVTAKAEALAATLEAGEQEAFKRRAAAVLQLWRKIPVCDAATNGPNQCKIANDLSCREAMRDIGPDGRHVPGLIEWSN
jgi:hypothetical protein